jgi:hypothetical protein
MGFFGGGGGAAAGVEYTVLSDFDSNNLYTGLAPKGTATSSAGWTIRRTTLNAEGAVTATGTKTNGVWNNRLTETYT